MDDRSAQDVQSVQTPPRATRGDAVLLVDATGAVRDRRGAGATLPPPGTRLADCAAGLAPELAELAAAAAKSDAPVTRRELRHEGRVLEVDAVSLGAATSDIALLITDVTARHRADAREAALAALTTDCAFALLPDGTIAAATPPAAAVLGDAHPVGLDLSARVHPDDRARLLEVLAGVPGAEPLRLRILASDGTVRALELAAATSADGEVVLCGRDVTATQGDAALLAAQHAVLDHLVGLQQLGHALDAVARFVEAQAAGGEAAVYVARGDRLELAAAPTLPRLWARASAHLAVPARDVPGPLALSGAAAELAHEQGFSVGWIVAARGGGSDASGAVVLVARGPKRFPTVHEREALAAGAALTALAVAHEHAVAAAHDRVQRDPLTGVLHRVAFVDALSRGPRAGAREPIVIVLVRIEDVEAVNEAYGYDAGDTVLRAIASELGACVRARDIVGRLGGATFAIAGPLARGHDATSVASRIAAALPTRVAAHGHRVDVAMSLVSTSSAPDEPPLDVLARADALLRADTGGRGTRSGTEPRLR